MCAFGLCLWLGMGSTAFAQAGTAMPAGPRPTDPAELERWQAESRRQAEERAAQVLARIEPEVEEMRSSNDREAIERLIAHIDGASTLDLATRRRLTGPLRDRQVELLCRAALVELERPNVEAAGRLISAARFVHDERGGEADAAVGEVLARLQRRYAEVIGAVAELSITADDLEAARATLVRGRSTAALFPDQEGVAARDAEARFAAVEQKITDQELATTIERARRAEDERDLRTALVLYDDAARKGADVDAAIARIESERRTPLADGGMSLVVPGLGQAVQGRPLAGGLFFLGTAAAVTGGLLLNASAEDRYDRYSAATTAEDADRLYDGIGTRWTGAVALFGTATVLHLWNVYDAYSHAERFNRSLAR